MEEKEIKEEKTNKKKKNKLWGSNPMIRKISKIDEVSDEHVTYNGIANKMMYFIFTIITGIILVLILNNFGHHVVIEDAIATEGLTFELSKISSVALVGFVIASILMIITPIISIFARKIIPVVGTLFCSSVGYVLTFLSLTIKEYKVAVIITLVVTIALFASLGFLYKSGKIKVSSKFKKIFLSVMIATIISSFILLIFAFIPSLRFIPNFVYGNPIISIIFAILGLIIACIFVIVDFDEVQTAVDNKLPVKYEWYCAYGLIFSFIYLYFKVLEIVLKLVIEANSE